MFCVNCTVTVGSAYVCNTTQQPIMSAKSSLRWPAFGCNALRVIYIILYIFLYYIIFSLISEANGIASCQESGQVVECHIENIQVLDVNYKYRNVVVNGIKCNVQYFANCICTLDDVKVTSNCSNGITLIDRVRYPPDTKYLNWNNSKLHVIRSKRFIRLLAQYK